MNFNNKWYEVVVSEEDKKTIETEASNMTAKEMCSKYKVSEYKLRKVLSLYNIKPKTPERNYIHSDVAHWALTYNNGRLRYVYYDMMKRCYDKKDKGYDRYGAKGITVCDEWKEDCRNFYAWAKDNGYEKGLTIDRIDNTKGYSPDNCRWTTYKVQSVNRECTRWIEFNGERRTLKDWAKVTGISYQVLADRIYRYGWTIERALTTDTMHDWAKSSKK